MWSLTIRRKTHYMAALQFWIPWQCTCWHPDDYIIATKFTQIRCIKNAVSSLIILFLSRSLSFCLPSSLIRCSRCLWGQHKADSGSAMGSHPSLPNCWCWWFRRLKREQGSKKETTQRKEASSWIHQCCHSWPWGDQLYHELEWWAQSLGSCWLLPAWSHSRSYIP